MIREIIRENVQIGVARARRTGKTLGRPRALVDEEKLCEQIADDQSIRSVAKQWGVSRGVERRLCAKRPA